MVMGKTYFEARPVGCDVIATICLCACVTALFSIGGISFNRYLHVCHSAYYPRIFTLRNNILMCIGFWVIGFVMTLPALVGWTDNKYDHKLMECHWSRTHSLSYTIFFSTCVIFTPVSIILISYIKIFLFFRASKQRVAASKGLQKQGSSKKDDAAIKLARSLFIIFSIFAVCWTPYAILALVDYKYNFRHEVMLFTVAFGHMHSTLNPIVYGLTNRHFRAAYARILTKVCNIRVKVEPETSIGATSMSEGTQHVNNSVNRETNTTSNMWVIFPTFCSLQTNWHSS